MCPLLSQSVQCSPHLHTVPAHVKPRAPAGAEGGAFGGPRESPAPLGGGLGCLDSGVRGRQMRCLWRSQLWQRLTDHRPSPTPRGCMASGEDREAAESQDRGSSRGSRPRTALRADVAVLQEELRPRTQPRPCWPRPRGLCPVLCSCSYFPGLGGPCQLAPSSTLPCSGRTLNSLDYG